MAQIDHADLFDGICDIVMNADRPGGVLEAICDFVGAESASLWSNQGTCLGKNIYILKSVHNRPDTEALIDEADFAIGEANVIAPQAFESRRPIIGLIGTPPFGSEWLEKQYTTGLPKLGIRQVAIVPIFDIEDEPISALYLYFRSVRTLDLDFLMGVGSILASTNEAIDKRLHHLRLERRKDRHELMTHVRIIDRKLQEISKEIDVERFSERRVKRIQKKSEDTIRSLNVLRRSYESQYFKERVESRHSKSVYIPLNEELHNILLATINEYKGEKTIVAGDVRAARKHEVLFHADDFAMMFFNLYSNAIKYSSPGSVVRTVIVRHIEALEVTISNDMPIDINDNLDNIFDYEVRGNGGWSDEIDGEGIGLGLVSDICDVYGIDIKPQYKEDGKKHTKVFSMRLRFPFDMVD